LVVQAFNIYNTLELYAKENRPLSSRHNFHKVAKSTSPAQLEHWQEND